MGALLSDDTRDWACQVRTQRVLAGRQNGRRPDLELIFTGAGSDLIVTRIVLWVEVKHGTAPATSN
jgi:hypothetical protein